MALGFPRFRLVEGVVRSWDLSQEPWAALPAIKCPLTTSRYRRLVMLFMRSTVPWKNWIYMRGDSQLWSLILSTTSFFSILYWTWKVTWDIWEVCPPCSRQNKKKKKVFGLLPTIVCFSVCTWYQAMAQGPAQISWRDTEFESKSTTYLKEVIIPNFNNNDLYVNSSNDLDGIYIWTIYKVPGFCLIRTTGTLFIRFVLLGTRDDMTFSKHGLEEE